MYIPRCKKIISQHLYVLSGKSISTKTPFLPFETIDAINQVQHPYTVEKSCTSIIPIPITSLYGDPIVIGSSLGITQFSKYTRGLGFPDTARCAPQCHHRGGHPSPLLITRGGGIYLIPFATHAFAPQGQERPREMPSPLVFRTISTDFTPTPCVPLPSNVL